MRLDLRRRFTGQVARAESARTPGEGEARGARLSRPRPLASDREGQGRSAQGDAPSGPGRAQQSYKTNGNGPDVNVPKSSRYSRARFSHCAESVPASMVC